MSPARRRPVAAMVAAVVTLLVLLTACTEAVDGTATRLGAAVSGGPAPSDPAPGALRFRDCTDTLRSAGLSVPDGITIGCGNLAVPLDYSRPHGRHIQLAVVRIHDDANTRTPVESLLFNPGGPGASGVQFSLGFFTQLPRKVLRRYDLIGFDPRGVGSSTPVHCLTDRQKDAVLAESPDVTTASGFALAKQQARRLAKRCEQAVGPALRYFTTANTARDMDQLRQAVGDDRMNYLGFSYGTELGWVYAHLFPKQVHTFVLDGAVDPQASDTASFAEQLQGFEKAFDQFAANCRTVTSCRQLSDPRATALQVSAAARAHPLPTGTARPLTYGLALTGILQALYSRQSWPTLATALISARQGDGGPLLHLADRYNERSADGSYSNIFDANTTISCNDSRPGPSDATIRSLARRWARQYPLFGRWSAPALFTCQQWQPHRSPVPEPNAATPTKVLVIGNLHDPATPYAGARHLTRDLGNAELLTWNGQGHTSYLSGSRCVDGYVNAYLTTGALPPDHEVCPAG